MGERSVWLAHLYDTAQRWLAVAIWWGAGVDFSRIDNLSDSLTA